MLQVDMTNHLISMMDGTLNGVNRIIHSAYLRACAFAITSELYDIVTVHFFENSLMAKW